LDQAHDEIRDAGADVVCAFMYRAQPTRNFCRQRGLELECLGDPERVAYRAVGLERGGAREMFGPRVALGMLRAARHGAVAGKPVGDTRQMPGTFVVAPAGRVVFAHYNRDQSDNPPIDRMLAAVRAAAAPAGA
jgi:peroxiredoxin